jgi:hypothetical protein
MFYLINSVTFSPSLISINLQAFFDFSNFPFPVFCCCFFLTQVCDNFAKGWLSWGSFCDRVFTMRKELEWAESAVCCFLQAVSHGNNRARMLLSRVLWLLSYDTESSSTLRG